MIKFTAAYGDQDKEVELSIIKGGYYHIYIDRYYYGMIHFISGRWVVLPQHSDYFDTADMDILSDIVLDNHFNI